MAHLSFQANIRVIKLLRKNRPMPSRRTVLLGSGGLTGLCGLGWAGIEHVSVTGAVKRKYIDVSWEVNGRQRHGHVLLSLLEPEGEISISYAPAYAEEAVQLPREITVDEQLDNRLHGEFTDVTYRLGVCGTASGECGFSMKRVSRDGFNQVQLGDTVTVANFENHLYVYSVTPRSAWSGPSEITTFDFADFYLTYP